MKPTFRLPQLSQAGFPLLIGFVAAVAFHGLFLAYHQLRRQRVVSPNLLQSRDNTPELLQFSSQPLPVTTLETLPLPKASVLPPPPSSDLLAPLGPSPGPKRAGTDIATPSRLSQKGPLAQRKGSPQIALHQKKPEGIRPKSKASAPQLDPSEWAVASEQLRSFVELHPLSPASTLSSSPKAQLSQQEEKAGAQDFTVPDAVQQEAYQKLWNQAQPSKVPMEPLEGGANQVPIEVRELPLLQSRVNDLEIRHQHIVVLNDKVLLFWLESQQVWILKLARDSSKS